MKVVEEPAKDTECTTMKDVEERTKDVECKTMKDVEAPTKDVEYITTKDVEAPTKDAGYIKMKDVEEPTKDAGYVKMKDVEELKLVKDIEDMKSKLNELDSKLSEVSFLQCLRLHKRSTYYYVAFIFPGQLLGLNWVYEISLIAIMGFMHFVSIFCFFGHIQG